MIASKAPRKQTNKILGLPQPVLCFRVYAEARSRHYIVVEVYRTWQQLARMHDLYFPRKRHHSVWGFLSKENKGMHFGTVRLYLRSCTDNTVTHEFHHAAMLWSQALRLAPHKVVGWDQWLHERVAEAHGNMVSQFWKRFSSRFKRQECWGFERIV